nr:MAG TPA: hypothetical protein [Caudoviricetes sp.]
MKTDFSIILNQYLWFIHIVTLTSPGYAQGYAVGETMMPFCEGL